jgi:acetone carboxylase gamma subunit
LSHLVTLAFPFNLTLFQPALSSEPLHPNWESAFDAAEREYYYYEVFTKEVSWDRPIVQPLAEQVQQRTAKRNLQGSVLDEDVSLTDAIKKLKVCGIHVRQVNRIKDEIFG